MNIYFFSDAYTMDSDTDDNISIQETDSLSVSADADADRYSVICLRLINKVYASWCQIRDLHDIDSNNGVAEFLINK